MVAMRTPSPTPASAFLLEAERLLPIQEALLGWYRTNARDLPWRRTRDPYAVLVSEVMLQQIQVVRAIPFYLAFLDRFPTVQSLAEASVADVIRVWGDLGRYRRITNLHATAKRIVAEFDGRVPPEVSVLRTLPGIGPYTAGAIACFAFGQDVGFLDTNARRVVHRVFVGPDVPAATVPGRALAGIAEQAVPPGRGWAWNQAVIELGALVCTARRPTCEVCPLHGHCAARASIAPAIAALPRAARNGAQPTAGGPNRLYRGRVLAALRAQAAGIDLRDLGSEIQPEFTDADLPWIAGVVESLRKDGLATIAEESPAYSTQPGNEAPEAGAIFVRLPD